MMTTTVTMTMVTMTTTMTLFRLQHEQKGATARVVAGLGAQRGALGAPAVGAPDMAGARPTSVAASSGCRANRIPRGVGGVGVALLAGLARLVVAGEPAAPSGEVVAPLRAGRPRGGGEDALHVDRPEGGGFALHVVRVCRVNNVLETVNWLFTFVVCCCWAR